MSRERDVQGARAVKALEERLLRELASRAQRLSQRVSDAVGLGPTDARCLDFVLDAPAGALVTAGYLAQKTGLTTGAITGVLDRLERAGFVVREKAPDDRRQVVVRAVPSRARTLEDARRRTYDAFSAVCESRSADALAVIGSFVDDVIAMLDDETEALTEGASSSQGPSIAEGDVHSAAVGRTRDAVLELTGGLSRCQIRACEDPKRLYRAALPGNRETPELVDGVLRIAKASGSFFRRKGTDAFIELAPRVAWEVRVRSGVSNVSADLAQLDIRSVELRSGVSDSVFSLSMPKGTVPFRIAGGVSDLRISRPAGVPLRVVIRGGASSLAIDALRIGSAGSELRWESPDYGDAQDRYDIEIKGGASDIKIDAG